MRRATFGLMLRICPGASSIAPRPTSCFRTNSVFWLVGFAASLAMSGGYQPGFVARVGGARSWLLLAGAIGACIAAFNNAMIPRIGIANLTFCLFLGQVVASALLATTGILSDSRDPITPARAIGIVLVVTGTSLFAYGGRVIRG